GAGAAVAAELGQPRRGLRGGETPRGSASRRLVLRGGWGLRRRFIDRDLRATDGNCRKVRHLRRVRDTSPRPPLFIYQRLDAGREVQGGCGRETPLQLRDEACPPGPGSV